MTVEELSYHGGLYDRCVKAILGIEKVKTEQMAIFNFIKGYGSYNDLCDRAGLNVSSIVQKSLSLIK